MKHNLKELLELLEYDVHPESLVKCKEIIKELQQFLTAEIPLENIMFFEGEAYIKIKAVLGVK